MRYLQNYHVCPLCSELLTIETVKQPPSIVTGYLSELRIRCDFAHRGCPEVVPVQTLTSHAVVCKFRPLGGFDAGRSAVTDNYRHDMKHQEAQTVAAAVAVAKQKCLDCCEWEKEVGEMKRNFSEMKKQLDRLRGETNKKLDSISKDVADLQKQFQLIYDIQESTAARREYKRTITTMNDGLNKLTLGFDGLEPPPTTGEKLIVISGGYSDWSGRPTNSAEIFSPSKKQAWRPLSTMTQYRNEASSIVYANHVIIAGGCVATDNASSTMEVLKPGRGSNTCTWHNFPAQMPHRSFAHRCIVSGNCMVLTGGWNPRKKAGFDGIHEILLVPPYSARLVARMPEVRCHHSAALVGSKLIILGGSTTGRYKDNTASVLEYNANNYNESKALKPLPFPMCGMATVVWIDDSGQTNLVLLGGCNRHGQALNAGFIYNPSSGEVLYLPPMKYHRDGCSAVSLGASVIVMGGTNKEKQILNTVEQFTFDTWSWKEVAPMINARSSATAVVISDA